MMEFHECLAVIIRRCWLVLAAAAVACACAWAASRFIMPTVYKSTATIIVGAPAASDYGQGVVIDPGISKVFYNLAESTSVIDGVRQRLSLNKPTEKVREQFNVAADYETGILKISASASTAEAARDMALSFIESLSEQSGKLNLSAQIRVIDAPNAPLRPASPNMPLNLLLAGVGGFFAGMLLAIYFGAREQTADDIPALQKASDLRTIGALPRIANRALRKEPVLLCPKSGTAREALNAIRANLLYLMETTPFRTALITSPRASEGKTTFAVNIAASMAEMGKRVLLVECNYKSPALFRLYSMRKYVKMDPPTRAGGTMDAMAYAIPSLGIDLISDTLPLQGNPDFIVSARMQPLPEGLREAYDLILLDCPALLTSADALLLGRLVQGVILVADYRRLSAAVLEKCAARLRQAGAQFLGLVVNHLPDAKILC